MNLLFSLGLGSLVEGKGKKRGKTGKILGNEAEPDPRLLIITLGHVVQIQVSRLHVDVKRQTRICTT